MITMVLYPASRNPVEMLGLRELNSAMHDFGGYYEKTAC